MSKKLLALYGLKYNPFSPEIPIEAVVTHPKQEHFFWRVEETLLHEGGFALISGEPGTGKSITLRILAQRLKQRRDVALNSLTHVSAHLTDFYRELGDLFGIALSANNRWCSFKTLRERWLAHMESTLLRPILLIDEAQEIAISVLNELRLLSSMQFDSRTLLTVILAGDMRINAKLKQPELVPLGSRIRVRLHTEHATPDHLLDCLKHLIQQAGNPVLMTHELMKTLSDHAMGNFRVLCVMANELLALAVTQEKTQMDEQLFFDCFSQSSVTKRKQT